MKISEMSVEQLVHSFSIFQQGDKIGTRLIPEDENTKSELIAAMRSQKQEILQYLSSAAEQQKRAVRERQEKIDAIPGLAELQAAINDLNIWKEEFEQNWERGDSGVGLRTRPNYDFEALCKQYPKAAAYIKADKMSRAAHDVKASAGEKAKERILNGEDFEQALADAEKEWSAYAMEHMWD